MKIINITNKDTYLCSLTYEEMKLITGDKIYLKDFQELLRNEIDIDLFKFNKLPSNYDLSRVDNAIQSLKSAVEFLNNKKESLNYMNSLKVE